MMNRSRVGRGVAGAQVSLRLAFTTAGAAGLVVLALFVPVLARTDAREVELSSSRPGERPLAGSPGASAPRATPPTTPPASPPSTTADPPTVTAPPPDEDAPLPAPAGCRDSADPACGPFHWDPPVVADQPVTVRIDWQPEDLVVGEEVLFTVTMRDLDSDHLEAVCTNLGRSACPPRPACRAGEGHHGPWTPPARRGGQWIREYRTTFETAGRHLVVVDAFTGETTRDCRRPPDPYGSRGRTEIHVEVAARSEAAPGRD